MTTVAPPAPVVTVTRTPDPMTAGQNYTLAWSATDATAMSRNCTSTGTGYVDNSTLAVSGTSTALANAAWVAYPSTCTWTATGYGGSGNRVETMTTVAAPVIKITYFHNDVSGTPMIATDASGNVLWKETYQPYGSRLNNQVASGNNKLWFAGKPYDGSTGLSYMGARYYDPVLGRFMAVDPKGVNPDGIHGFNRYAYANNNPYKFVDRDGRAATLVIPAAVTVLLAGGIYANASPDQQRRMVESANRLMRKVSEAIDRVGGRVFNESAEGDFNGGAAAAPSLPSGIVGEQSDPRAGPNKSGGKWTSGPLAPENGGTGDFGKDLDHLTGGTRPSQPGDKAPPGSRVGANGIFGRPTNSSGGSSIDIPATGKKPHETLHYP
jgi:RHS repeat-associated protein